MTARLVIDEVHAERFGGLTNTNLSLGGDRLVVVHGPNESGKTTLATLLAWLLVGPTGDNEAALRLGAPGDQLAGRLTGSLDGDPLRIDGTFTLLQRGLPNTRGITARLRGDRLDLDAWRTHLAGIDPAVLTATYRMWGADLHSDDTVLAEVAQAAVAGLGGALRISDVMSALQRQALECLSSTAAGSESYATLNGRRHALETDIKDIAGNAARYQHLEQRVSDLNGELTDALTRAAQASRRRAAIQTLLAVGEERRHEKQAGDDLAALPEVPEDWQSIIADVDGFTTAAQAVDHTTTEVRAAWSAVDAATAPLGLTSDEASQLRVTHTTVTAVQVASTELTSARTALGQAIDAHDTAVHAARTADVEAQRAVVACPDIAAEVLATRPITDADTRPVRMAITQWTAAERRVTTARSAMSEQQSRVDTAAAICESAQTHWERFGTGITAQQWRVTPAPMTPAPTLTTASRPWPAVAAAGLVALVAVLVLPRWVALAVTAAAFAALTIAVRRTRPAPTTAPIDTVVATELADAASAVIVAQASLDDAGRDLHRLQADLQRSIRDVDMPRDEVDAQCRLLGLTRAETPEVTSDLVDRAVEASAALVAQHHAHQKVHDAQRTLDTAHTRVADLLNGLSTTVQEAGVPQRLPVESAANTIDGLRHLTDLVAAASQAELAADQARRAFDELLTPLGPSAHERSRAWLMAEARRLGALQARRVELDDDRNRLNLLINHRFRDEPDARKVANEGRSDVELTVELEQLDAVVTQAEADRDRLNQERGELQQQLDQLKASDMLSAKRLELGSVVERADEQLLAGVVAVAARSLLARTATERRRTQRPALVARASALLSSVANEWQQLMVDPDSTGKKHEVTLVDTAGVELASSRLSTGARALMNLALRLATAELDAERRRVRFPIICDDPLVHLDDRRAQAVMPLLARAAADGHQVIVFTCHGRTVDAGRAAGGRVVPLG